jgi:hypothetical protein
MHVVACGISNPIDRITDRFDVVVEGAFHAALFLLGRAEVDDPNVEPQLRQRGDTADVGRDIVDLRGDHQRRDQEQWRLDARTVVVPTVPSKPRDAHLMCDLVWRMLGIREVSEPRKLEGVFSGHRDPAKRCAPAWFSACLRHRPDCDPNTKQAGVGALPPAVSQPPSADDSPRFDHDAPLHRR